MLVDVERIKDAWLKGQRDRVTEPKPQYVNWISGAGDPCDRRLVLQRTHWQHSSPPSEYLQAIFERGNIAEDAIGREQMRRAGYVMMGPQRFQVEEGGEVLWSGRTDDSVIDPRMGPDPPVFAWECKFVNTHVWKSLNTLEDILRHKSPWVRSLPGQLTLYVYAKGTHEAGILYLIDSETWLPKVIEVPLDFAYAQELIDRGKRINAHVALKELPPPIEWSDAICGRCRMLHICLPDQIRTAGGFQIWQTPGMLEKLNRREELAAEMKPIKEEFDEIDSHVKHIFKAAEGTQFAVGDFMVSKSERNVKGYTVEPRVDTIVQVKRVGAKVLRDVA
jgi:hypothetical protein